MILSRNLLKKEIDIAIHKKKQAQLKDEVSMYRLEEDTIDYVLFRIREFTGKCIKKKFNFIAH